VEVREPTDADPPAAPPRPARSRQRALAESGPGWEIGLSGVLLAFPGALLVARAPRNAVSWVVAGAALFWALDGLASSWLTFAVLRGPTLPGASPAFWFVQRFGAWLLSSSARVQPGRRRPSRS
jgi:hypothetical protein